MKARLVAAAAAVGVLASWLAAYWVLGVPTGSPLEDVLGAGCAGRWALAVVPSGDPEDQRTRGAVRLLHAGCADEILISGHGQGGDSAAVLAKVALGLGVPTERLVLETEARSTRENALAVKALRPKAARVVVLTEQLHARRTLGALQAALADAAVDVVTVGSTELDPGRVREATKLWVYRWLGWA